MQVIVMGIIIFTYCPHIVDNISDYARICQVLFDEIDGVKDQSVGSGRAEIAISGLSQSS